MTEGFIDLTEFANTLFLKGFAVFLRVSAFVILLPAFGEQTVSVRVRLGVAVAFTMIVTPAVPSLEMSFEFTSLLWIAITEITAGLILGISLRLFVLALQTAGSIAAQSTSLAQILGGAVSEPVPAMGHILVMGGLALAVMTGLHVHVSKFLVFSYELLPMGLLPTGSNVAEWGLNRIRHAFAIAFTLAAPFIILSVLYNVALGVINKAMPQLMVAFVGAPVITAGGLMLLALSAPLLLETWLTMLNTFIANPLESVP